MAVFSGSVTHSPYFAFTATCRSTYWQRNPALSGSHSEASESDFVLLAGPSTARRFNGSLASSFRRSAGSPWAPDCQAFLRATTWSICTAEEVVRPRVKWIVAPVYGSARVPEVMVQSPSLVVSVRSRARMSSRVSHPLPSMSAQASPKSLSRL